MPTAAELSLVLKFRDQASAALKQAAQGMGGALQVFSDRLQQASTGFRQFSRNASQLALLLTGPFVLAFRTAASRMPEVRDTLAVLQNQFVQFQLTLSQAALPVLRTLAAIIERLVTVFRNLPEQTRENIVRFTLLAGVVATLVATMARLAAITTFLGSVIAATGAKALAARHPLLALGLTAVAIAGGIAAAKAALGALNDVVDEFNNRTSAAAASSVKFADTMTQWKTQFTDVGARSAQLLIQGIQGVEDRFTSLFESLITRSISAKEAFRQFALSVLQMIAQMIARFIAAAIVLSLLNLIPGFSTLATASDQAARQYRVRAGMPVESTLGAGRIPGGPAVFHHGGEVPAMLEAGEFVVNRQATQRNRGLLDRINRGESEGAPTVQNIFIINATDEASFRGKLQSHADLIESIFQRAMRRNSGAMREAVRM